MLFKKLIILNATVLFLLTAVFVGMNLSATRQIVENEVYGTFNAQMDDGTKDLSHVFESARDLTLELCASESIQNVLRAGYKQEIDPEMALSQARDYAVDKSRLFSYFNTEIILMLPDGMQCSRDEETGEIKSSRPYEEGYDHQILSGSFVWYYRYTDYGAYVRVSHAIYDEEDWGKILGIASININRDYLLYALNSMWMGDYGRAFMLDEQGNLLFPYTGSQEFPDDLSSQTPVIVQEEGGQVLYFQRTIPTNGYRIIGEVKNVDTLRQMSDQRHMIFLTAAVILGTAAMVTLAITYRISTPILQLANTMEEVGRGNFDIEIPVPPGRGEIAILYRNFSQMLKKQKKLTEEIYGAKVKEKEAELRALQAQINPHFLYNTLDSINWMAVKYGADDIEEVVTDLSQMLRYSLNNGLNILKISEELIQIQSYIKIQQIRFSDSVSVIWDVDPEIMDHRIIKLLLQPLVENALLHGFDESGQNGKMVIEIKHENNAIRFCVKNNGRKMDLTKMEEAVKQPEKEQSSSYGLRNVNDRLVKYYGPESRLRFCVDDTFSSAFFIIPFKEA